MSQRKVSFINQPSYIMSTNKKLSQQVLGHYYEHHFKQGAANPTAIFLHFSVMEWLGYRENMSPENLHKIYVSYCADMHVMPAPPFVEMSTFRVNVQKIKYNGQIEWRVSACPTTSSELSPFKQTWFSEILETFDGTLMAHSCEHACEQANALLREGFID